ncbi:MAG: hypothetical protein HQ564_09175 [Candidatus Saganbacteria bacterium]|nr:hypothetical protein [Candidatus Saganbacteria bacterium]
MKIAAASGSLRQLMVDCGLFFNSRQKIKKGSLAGERYYENLLLPPLALKLKLVLGELTTQLRRPVVVQMEPLHANMLNRAILSSNGLHEIVSLSSRKLEHLNEIIRKYGFELEIPEDQGDSNVPTTMPGIMVLALSGGDGNLGQQLDKALSRIPAEFFTQIAAESPGALVYSSFLLLSKIFDPASASNLELFRLDPQDQRSYGGMGITEAAKKIEEEGNQEEVAKIFLSEIENPAVSILVLMQAANYFLEIEDQDNFIRIAEKLLFENSRLAALIAEEPLRELAIEKIFLLLAQAYNQGQKYQKASRVLKAIWPLHGNDDIDVFLINYSLSQLKLGNFNSNLLFLSNNRTIVTKKVKSLCRILLLNARLFNSLYSLPNKKQIDEIIQEFESLAKRSDLEEFQITSSFSFLLYLWVHLQRGDVAATRQIFEKDPIMQSSIGQFLSSLNPFLYYAIEACLLDKEGKNDEAKATAKKALEYQSQTATLLWCPVEAVFHINILGNPELGVIPKFPEPPPEKLLALHQVMARIIGPEENNPNKPSALNRSKEPLALQTEIDNAIFRSNRLFYDRAFPKAEKDQIDARLRREIFESRELLGLEDYEQLAGMFKEEQLLFWGRDKFESKKLGISKVTLLWNQGLKARIYFDNPVGDNSTTMFEGEVSTNYGLIISSSRDLQLAQLFLEAAILEELIEKL